MAASIILDKRFCLLGLCFLAALSSPAYGFASFQSPTGSTLTHHVQETTTTTTTTRSSQHVDPSRIRQSQNQISSTSLFVSAATTRDSQSDILDEPLLSPRSPVSDRIILEDLQLSPTQYDQLVELARLIVDEWNPRVNLVSRKDCSLDVVWTRHILPSLAPLAVNHDGNSGGMALRAARRIVDVGTGGGFPGLPLAIALNNNDNESSNLQQMVLLDSVGKKLAAVQDMAEQLGLSDVVQIHHGRAEEFAQGRFQFDVATGRAVSELGQFCSWMHSLLQTQSDDSNSNSNNNNTPCLLYWIGGSIEPDIYQHATADTTIAQLLPALEGINDKHCLQFPQSAVARIAQDHLGTSAYQASLRKTASKGNSRQNTGKRRSKAARGSWKTSRRNINNKDQQGVAAAPKQRGYEDFERYDSSATLR